MNSVVYGGLFRNLRIIFPVSIRSFPAVLSKWLLMTAVRVNTSLILRTASPHRHTCCHTAPEGPYRGLLPSPCFLKALTINHSK